LFRLRNIQLVCFSSAPNVEIQQQRTGRNCPICGYHVKIKSNLLTHLRKVHGKTDIYRCEFCTETFDFLRKLVTHENIHKDAHSKSISINYSSHCSIKLIDEELKGSGREHVCTICGKSFEWIRKLRLHMKRAHATLECILSGEVKEPPNCINNREEGNDVKTRRTKRRVIQKTSKKDKETCDTEFSSIDNEQSNDPIKRLDSDSSVCKEDTGDVKAAASVSSVPFISNNTDGFKKYVCSECQDWFSSRRGLMRHIEQLHNMERYDTCVVCGERFSGLRKLKLHMIEHSSVNSFDCPDCDENMNSVDAFRAHLELHRTGQQCVLCSKPFSDESMLTSHMHQEHEEDMAQQSSMVRFSCSHCLQTFAHKTSFQRHVRSHELDMNPGVMCSICGTFVSNQRSLNHHMSSSKCVRPVRLECSHCDKKFLFSASLNYHVQFVHEGIKPFDCPDCEKRFTCRNALVYHSRVHTGVLPPRPHVCTVCGQAFEKQWGLKFHMACHTGVAPSFFCLVCNKAFRLAGKLSQHMKKHSDERPYECQVCTARFKYKEGLKRHVKIHSELPICFCQVCGKGFRQTGNMKIHMRTHSGERPYECNVCSQTFPHQGSWKKHVETHKKTMNFMIASRPI